MTSSNIRSLAIASAWPIRSSRAMCQLFTPRLPSTLTLALSLNARHMPRSLQRNLPSRMLSRWRPFALLPLPRVAAARSHPLWATLFPGATIPFRAIVIFPPRFLLSCPSLRSLFPRSYFILFSILAPSLFSFYLCYHYRLCGRCVISLSALPHQ